MQAALCNKQFKELGSEMNEYNALQAELENMLGSFTRPYSAPSTAAMPNSKAEQCKEDEGVV
jgi:hypothetical protein